MTAIEAGLMDDLLPLAIIHSYAERSIFEVWTYSIAIALV
jgi:hypothetical protein